jgi:imidazoleglycerol phosphate dehydratase HisB
MNEQIQKLAELAGFNLHNDLIDGHNFHHEIEKFAQLVVRECADLADLYKNPNNTTENAITLSNAIKNKFGIYE